MSVVFIHYTHRTHKQRNKADYHKQHIPKLLITENMFDFYNFLELQNTRAPEETSVLKAKLKLT